MKLLAKVALGIWVSVVVYFVYTGITTVPSELDSIGYHIPIAESVAKGTVFKPNYISPYSYYPGTGEAILALFMVLHLPLNLFNVLGLVLLFWVMRELGGRGGLDEYEATILAVGMSLLPTVVRLPMTQLVDIWLAVWWGWWLLLVENPKRNILWFGIASGLLVGTKISGIMLLGVGLLFFWRNIKSWKWVWVTGIVGGFWYVRNWVVMGNPVYPLDFWMWKGHPVAKLPIVWRFLLFEKGYGLFLQALVSEFLGWAVAFGAIIWLRNKWIMLGIINLGLFLFMPGSPGTIVSNCRYLIPAMMTLALGLWIEAKKHKWVETLAILAVINSAMVLSQIAFRPKIVLFSLVLILILVISPRPAGTPLKVRGEKR